MIYINYHNITHDDMNNGDGLRVVLWLSGCSHHCHNCQNPQTWNPNNGVPFDETAKQEIFDELSKDYISEITLSGGDPLHEQNLDGVLSLVKEIRLSFPEKTIWLYTGYIWNDILEDNNIIIDDYTLKVYEDYKKRQEIISMCNVVVDGEYIDGQRNLSKKWVGSDNQRVIDVQKSLTQNKIVLYCD